MSGIRSRRARIALAAIITPIALLAGSAVASAQTITVSGTGDGGGSCSGSPVSCPTLRTAVAYVNGHAEADTISLGAGAYTITSSNGTLDLTTTYPVTIAGQGAASTEITQSSNTKELLDVEHGDVTITGVTFADGDAPASGPAGGNGGAIYNDATLTLSGDDFNNNNANGGGNASVTEGGYSSSGGAVYNHGLLNVAGCEFNGNDAKGAAAGSQEGGESGNGGAIYNEGELTVASSSFDSNEAEAGTGASYSYGDGSSGEGGAIYNDEGTMTVTNTTFGASTPNFAEDSSAVTSGPDSWGGQGGEGGAVFDYDGYDTFSGDTFEESSAFGAPSGNQDGGDGGEGGAMYLEESAVAITGGSFTGNVAEGAGTSSGANEPGGGEGGAIGASDSTLDISGTSFATNDAYGGAAGTTESGRGGDGGAIYIDSGNLTMSGATFTSDQATNGTAVLGGENYESRPYGGAIYLGADAQVTGSTFTSNTVTASGVASAPGGNGGAVAMEDGADVAFTASTFTGNSAAAGGTAGSPQGGDGGAIEAEYGGDLTATQDTFSSNSAPNGYGGAISADMPLWLEASTLTGNSAENGGAIFAYAPSVSIVNSTIAGNTAERTSPGDGYGGGLDFEVQALALASDTIVGNTAYGSDDGGNLSAGGEVFKIHDTIIAKGSLLGSGATGSANCSIGYTQIDDQGYNAEDSQSDGNECQLAGPGDLVDSTSLDASLGSLASNGGPTQTIALLPGSPAIDAGDPAGCTDTLGNALTSDQRGDTRPAGGRCDIGAYEYQPPAAAVSTPPPPAPKAPVLSGLTLTPGVFLSVNGGGSAITYNDSEAALTTFTVTGKLAGYKHKKGACKALPKSGKHPKHTKPCTLSFNAGSFTHQDTAGTNIVLLPGKPNGHKLPHGTYTLSAKAVLGGLAAAPVTTTFKIAG